MVSRRTIEIYLAQSYKRAALGGGSITRLRLAPIVLALRVLLVRREVAVSQCGPIGDDRGSPLHALPQPALKEPSTDDDGNRENENWAEADPNHDEPSN